MREELRTFTGRAETKGFDGRAGARRDRAHVALERAEDVLGQLDDLARRAVAHAQRLDALVRDAEIVEERGPVREAVLGRDGLRGVARERHRALLARRVEEHGELER